jgi:hypothetical protein
MIYVRYEEDTTMERILRFALMVCIFSCLLLLFPCEAFAIPQAITVSGYMEDSAANPVNGNFAYEVKFYADQTTTTLLGDAKSTTTIASGVFAIVCAIPEQMLVLDTAWYSLAIDTDRNGLGDQDLFQDRFQITAVPYALTGEPAPFYTTNPASAINVSPWPNALFVSPFYTGAGGVKFRKMSCRGAWEPNSPNDLTSALFTFGIYDSSGHAVVISKPIIVAPNTGILSMEAAVSGKLKPSKLYYAAWSVNHGFQVMGPWQQPIPGDGQVKGVVTNGQIPTSFDPAKIEPLGGNYVNPGISLYLRDE